MLPIHRLLLSAILLASLPALSVPSTLSYQGRLFAADGRPRTGTPTVVFKLFDQETGGEERWSETVVNVPLTNGFYALSLGQHGTPALEGVVVAFDNLWMELTVDGTPLLPRQPLTTIPFAMKARNLKGGSVEATSVKVADKPIVLKVAGKGPDEHGNVDLTSLSPTDAGLPACNVDGQMLKSNGLGGLECAPDNDAQTLTVTGNAVAISNGNSASLPPATASALGVVRAGSGLSVDANGLMTSSPSVSLSGPNLTVGGTTVNLASIYAGLCPSGYVFETTCVDRNECLTNNGGCHANATCTNTVGSRTCACKARFEGDGLTCTPIGDWLNTPIPHGVGARDPETSLIRPNQASYAVDPSGNRVKDNITGLEWQRTSSATTYTWSQAGTYCDVLEIDGLSDWRLPMQIELLSIMDETKTSESVSIDATAFPNTPGELFWTSTPYAGDSSQAWFVSFYGGRSGVGSMSGYSGRVRCVR